MIVRNQICYYHEIPSILGPNIDEFIILTFKNECRIMLFASDKTSHTNSNTCMRCLQHYFVDLDFNCLDVGHVWPLLNNPQVSPPHSFPTTLNCKNVGERSR